MEGSMVGELPPSATPLSRFDRLPAAAPGRLASHADVRRSPAPGQDDERIGAVLDHYAERLYGRLRAEHDQLGMTEAA